MSDISASELPKELRALVSLWEAKRDGRRMPARSQFTIQDLRPWLGRLHVIEILPGDYRYAVFATSSTERIGTEYTGQLLSTCKPERMAREAIALYDRVVALRAPLLSRMPPTVIRERLYSYTRAILPLSEDHETPDRLLIGMHYDLIDDADAEAAPH